MFRPCCARPPPPSSRWRVGPWLARLPLELLDRLAEPRPRPLSTRFGRQHYRAGFIARRSAEDLAPFRALEETVRETALETSARLPG